MPAIKVTKNHFTGASRLHGMDPNGLSAVIRGLAQDNARRAVADASVPDYVDSSTGTAGSSVVPLPDPATVNASSSALGAPKAGLDTAIGKQNAALVALAENMNKARVRLGLPAITYTGTPATSGTIPAQDKTLTAAQGNATATAASVNASLAAAENGIFVVARGMEEVLNAVGVKPPVSTLTGKRSPDPVIGVIPATVASSTGSDAANNSQAVAALVAFANDVATLASVWNTTMGQSAGATTPLHVVAA